MNQRSDPRPPLVESPWFWMYLFSAAALVALALIGSKYARRQAMIEQNYEGRQEAARRMARPSGENLPPDRSAEPPSGSDLIIGLQPLAVVFEVLLVVAAAGLWWRHKRCRAAPPL